MKKNGGGVILATASIAFNGGARPHAYLVAKAAVISLIENVAAELGPHASAWSASHPAISLHCPSRQA
jgi:NAD(P)-dependent dehydrogenase (short-subunit alcohol dehydrogenase family)